jgi:hypothetical protein
VPPDGTKTWAVLFSVVNQHATPLEDGVATSVTVPLNPLMLVMVMTVCCSEFRGMYCEGGLSEMENCCAPLTVTATVVVRAVDPFVAVIVTVYVPVGVEAVVETVRVEVAVPPERRFRFVALRETVGPAGEIEGARLTALLNPLKLVSVMVEVAEDPGRIEKLLGLALRL